MEKICVDENNKITITCPRCGLEKNIDVMNFKDTHKRLMAKCQCGEVFHFALEFRTDYRKNVWLHGEYFVRGKDEKGEMNIENISASGIRFSTIGSHNIFRDDIVEFKFTLDNPARTEIQELVKAIWIIDKTVGSRYINQSRLQRIWLFT